jgi:dimethylargininase
MSAIFKFTKALVSGVPQTLPASALRLENSVKSNPVNLELAIKQQEEYVSILQEKVGLEIIRVKVNDEYPDCVFVEDPVVLVNDTALLTTPGHVSRQGETKAIKEALEPLGLNLFKMEGSARMDGGDVLFTGKEFFVGLSTRTNKEGVDQLSKVFPMFPITCIPVNAGLHLKSCCSMVGEDVIALGSSSAAKLALKLMKEKAHFSYEYLTINDDKAANCIYANDVLIISSRDAFPDSFDQLNKIACNTKVPLSLTELNKVDGCFTCCSVLIP